MDAELKRSLMRLLHGEVAAPEEQALKGRLARDPQARRFFDDLSRLWDGLEMPPSPAVPRGFSNAVVAKLRGEGVREEVSWRMAPSWVRAITAAAALAGILVGSGAASLVLADDLFEDSWTEAGEELSLVEGYVEALAGDPATMETEGQIFP